MDKRTKLFGAISFLVMFFCMAISLVWDNASMRLVWTLLVVLFTQLSSSIFFPIVTTYFEDKRNQRKQKEQYDQFFLDLTEGGITYVYKDREKSSRPRNGVSDLHEAFQKHRRGPVRLVGVSLRVFFHETSEFYTDIAELCERQKDGGNISIKALVSSESSPETTNRALMESSNNSEERTKKDIAVTRESVETLRSRYGSSVHLRTYNQAPYCTAIIFPDACYFSPNLLSKIAPVKLPLIIFKKGSHGYTVLDDYFSYLWGKD